MPVTQPAAWTNITGAPVKEGLIANALSVIDGLMDPVFLPAQRHVQLLLYLVVTPKATTVSAVRDVPSPLAQLYRLLDLHGAALAPLVPHLHHGPTEWDDPRTPDWLAWAPDGDLERAVRARMRKCAKHGIWALLWADKPMAEGKNGGGRKRRASDDGDDDDGGAGEEGALSDGGWALLPWLVALWSAPTEVGPHPLLAQLHKPPRSAGLAHDDARAPLAVVRAGYTSPVSAATPERREACARLLALLIGLATPPRAPFHTSSLLLALLSLLRVDTAHLPPLLRAIPDWRARAHVLAYALEDAAGVRQDRDRTRKSAASSRAGSRSVSVAAPPAPLTRATRSSRRSDTDDPAAALGLGPPFSPPAVDYALDLIALPSPDPRAPLLAAALVSALAPHVPSDPAWSRLTDDYVATHDGVLRRALAMAQKLTRAACVAEDPTSDLEETAATVPIRDHTPESDDSFDETPETVPLSPLPGH